ncbi:MAG: hypothetical protein J6A04_04910 [Clostridia bacterium]|nr:hypothetical protein [Clostridia bacterium]
MNEIRTIYFKELSNIDEIFEEKNKLPIFLKKMMLFFKKIFCIVTVDGRGFYILPYKNLTSFLNIKLFFIKKILIKLDSQVVLSKKLDSVQKLKDMCKNSNIKLVKGVKLANYLMPEMIQYICKMTGKEKEKQEITLLMENRNYEFEKMIIELASQVRRIQIVTNKIGQFKKLENDLENEYGLLCQITNNKRKSLLKSKIIINFDSSQELLNQFAINPNAIVIDINEKTQIIAKAFCGIHIYDYQMNSDNKELPTSIFDIKKIYEARMLDKNYAQIRKIVKEENLRIINLIGKKGIIDRREYTSISKKLG